MTSDPPSIKKPQDDQAHQPLDETPGTTQQRPIRELKVEVRAYVGPDFPSAEFFDEDPTPSLEKFDRLKNLNPEEQAEGLESVRIPLAGDQVQDASQKKDKEQHSKILKMPPRSFSPPPKTPRRRGLATTSGEITHTISGVDYEIVRPLGKGGQGSVYLANRISKVYRNERLVVNRRPVAIKFVESFSDEDLEFYISSLLSEWDILGKFDHQNIVKSQSLEQDADSHMLFVEYDYIEGIDLERLCELHDKNGFRLKIPDLIIAFFGWLIASGLSYAHKKGIVHMDVKPQNIMVGPQGYPMLCDFGISKPIEFFCLNEHSTISGTLEYIPPEVSIESHAFCQHFNVDSHENLVDGRADVYQLGCTLYYMATGFHPNTPNREDLDPAHRMVFVVQQQLSSLVHPDHIVLMDHNLSAMICDALEPDPRDRISMDDLGKQLAKYLYPGGLGIVRQDIVSYLNSLKEITSEDDRYHHQHLLNDFYIKSIDHRRVSRSTGENSADIPLSDLFEPLEYTQAARDMIQSSRNPARRPLRKK